LVIFAGPRKTSETSVEEFFYSYAHGPSSASSGFAHQQALKNWIWPQIHTVHGLTTSPHQVYGHLVTDSEDADLQGKILSELKDQFEQAKAAGGDAFEGMIIGSEEFDRVGPNPYSQDDALYAVERLIDTLGLPPSSVTIVLLYRTPRLDQWLGIFESIPFDDGENTYQNLLCNDVYMKNYAWDYLQNSMNPLRMALFYALQGYYVRILDLTGLEREGLDVEHVIGCQVLNGECDSDGFLVNLRDESYLIDSAIHDSIQTDFADLTITQESDLEKLFLLRDCAFDFVRNGATRGVSWEHQVNIGLLEDGCTDKLVEVANALVDTDYFINVLQSQVDCNEDPVSIKAILEGTVITSTPSPTDHAEEDAPVSAPDVAPPTEGEELPEELGSFVDLPYAPKSQASSSTDDGDTQKKSPLVWLSILGVGVIAFVVWKRRSSKRLHPRDLVNTPDFELQPSLEDSVQQDWTKTFD